MADRYLLESGAPDGYLLEDGSGVLLLETPPAGVKCLFNISQFRAGFAQVRSGLQVIEDQLVCALAATASYWNPADKGDWVVLSNGDRNAHGQGAASSNSVRSVTSQSSGKWYAEISADGADFTIGIANATPVMQALSGGPGGDADSVGYYTGDGNIYENGSGTAYGATTVLGDIIGLAVDVTAKKFYLAINNVWQNSADPAAGTGGYTYSVTGAVFLCAMPGNTTDDSVLSTASGDFTYTPPTGFSAWG